MIAPIGSMRRRVTLQAPVDAPDGAGGFTRAYRDVGRLYATIEALGADDRFEAQRQEQMTNIRAIIRWRADVASEMRLLLGERRLRIRTVYDPDGRKRRLYCLCEEISDGAQR